jgi:predicted DNA-binding transcriptional regulator AlpA
MEATVSLEDELRVLTLKEFAAMCGLSIATVKRMIANGEGPQIIRLSPRRIGVRMIDALRWQEARLRKAAA